jgi:two-component system response regulator
VRRIQRSLTVFALTAGQNGCPIRILLVEDNKIDARLTRHAIQRVTGWTDCIDVVDDGEKAIQFLSQQHPFANASKPDLVILDLNLPRYDGLDVLRFIRSRDELRNLTVFIFSSSPADMVEDQVHRERLAANSYFEKPSELATYGKIAHRMHATWAGSEYRTLCAT